GGTAERNFHQSMMMSDGSWSIFADRPIALILAALIAALLCWPPAQALLRRRDNRDAALAGAGKP
ncbi:MAG: tripartite tricarboxylate transporter permease, partial [Alphaproteobacteria bacterium]|nr:tripartite tricarboxylate transporter permease [Alphaproteobacteria bacterium]